MAIELPELLVPDAAAWRDWLATEHSGSPGVWLVLSRRGGTVTTLTYAEALDEALCVGWIDGQKGSRDEGSFRQRFTPRTNRSKWSARNVTHIARLTEQGRMLPAGLAAVDAAKADGWWDVAYAGPATDQPTPEFLAAVAANPAAQAMYDVLTSQNRYAFTYRIGQAKRPETKAKLVTQFVEMLARGETIHPQRKRPES